MKKTFLLLLTVMLAFGMTLVSCGGDDEGPSTYTVTFIDGTETITTVTKVLEGKTVGSVPALDTHDGGAEYNTFDAWYDAETGGNKVDLSTTPINKNLTVYARYFDASSNEALTVGSNAEDPIEVEVTMTDDVTRDGTAASRGYYYFKFDDSSIAAGEVVSIDFNFSITKQDGSAVTETIHQFGFQSSLDNYQWTETDSGSLKWDTGGAGADINAKFRKGGDQTEKQHALNDKLLRFVVHNADGIAVGTKLKVTFNTLNIENLGEPFTVTFKANGGVGDDVAVEVYNGERIASNAIPVFTKTGQEIYGWATSATATSADKINLSSYTVDANVTLYAIWATATTTSIGTTDTALTATVLDTLADDSILLITVTGTANPGNGWGIGKLCYNVDTWPDVVGLAEIKTPDAESLTFTVSYSIGDIKAARAASANTTADIVVNVWSTFSVSDISVTSFTFN
ncbi:MAG: InlB B-repeat-containing protein [Treponema sp.]|nr:InlB B-repeat-containing protein [Treponema sp.]